MIPAGTVASLNVGAIEEATFRGRQFQTAFRKKPVEGRIRAERVMLQGDAQASIHLHEGENAKALYAYALEDYEWFAATYRIAVEPALFGENLTLRGVDLGACVVGDRWRAGDALLEVSEPRLPCYKFGWRMNDPAWVKIFATALRPGSYFRVVEPGEIGAGDAVSLEYRPSEHQLTVREVMRIRLYAPGERAKFAGVAALPFNYRAWAKGEPDILNGP